MLRPEFMSASDTTENKFNLAVSTAIDVPSLESGSWPEKWRTLEDVTPMSKVLDSNIKLPLRSAGARSPCAMITRAPVWVICHNLMAKSPGKRTQPCDAG